VVIFADVQFQDDDKDDHGNRKNWDHKCSFLVIKVHINYSVIIYDFSCEVNSMYNFNNRKNKRIIGIIGLVLAAALIITTVLAGLFVS
jgi:hypothetical protein